MTLAFGESADFDLLKKISNSNDGLAKRIYEGSDAAIQLENFYSQISSPLLSNVKITYVGDSLDDDSFSEKETKTLYNGTELVIAGKLQTLIDYENSNLTVFIEADGAFENYQKYLSICLRYLHYLFILNIFSIDFFI